MKLAASRARLGLIADWSDPGALQDVLDRAGIRSCFHAVVCSRDVGWRMPHRNAFDRLLQQLGAGAPGTLFVGTRFFPDVHGAIHARLDTLWIDTQPDEAPPPRHVGAGPRPVPPLRVVPCPLPAYRARSLLDVAKLLENGSPS